MVVAGGQDEGNKAVKTVEVMVIATHKWCSVVGPVTYASGTICGDHIYLLGGWKTVAPTKAVYTCSLTDLFQTCKLRSVREQLTQSLSGVGHARWDKIADLPVTRSTCVTLRGQLLAIGGEHDSLLAPPTSEVRVYRPSSNRWEVFSKMSIKRRSCLAVTLRNNQVMVVGGRTTTATTVLGTNASNSVEIATFI